MKNPQNQGRIPRFCDWLFDPEQTDAGPISRRKLDMGLMLSGDERDRTANLLVANQALSQLSYVPVGRTGLHFRQSRFPALAFRSALGTGMTQRQPRR